MGIYSLGIPAAFGAGFVNAVAGGGTLLTFPALLYGGLSSISANATSTVAIWPGSVTSSWAYRHQLGENRARVWMLAVPSLLGGLAGAILLLGTSEKVFRFIVPFLILLACGLLMLNEPIGRWISKRAESHPKKHAAALWLSQFAIAVYGGYFGAGIGILMLAAMAIFLPEDLQAANGMKNFFAVLINGVAAVYFIVVGAAMLKIALVMMLAAIVGGFVGAKTAQRMSPRILRAAVVVFGVIIAVHLMVKG
jgi:uncharacterized membrane protein YfcA